MSRQLLLLIRVQRKSLRLGTFSGRHESYAFSLFALISMTQSTSYEALCFVSYILVLCVKDSQRVRC
jgi:hypothetical protein